ATKNTTTARPTMAPRRRTRRRSARRAGVSSRGGAAASAAMVAMMVSPEFFLLSPTNVGERAGRGGGRTGATPIASARSHRSLSGGIATHGHPLHPTLSPRFAGGEGKFRGIAHRGRKTSLITPSAAG